MSEHIKHNCGLFGVWGSRDAVERVYWGLYALQHRGEESAGIASTDGKEIIGHKEMGLVTDVFDRRTLTELANPAAAGHVRYSTFGVSTVLNAQPLIVNYAGGSIAIAHNGNLINARTLRDHYEKAGSIFQTMCDSEVIAHIMAKTSPRRGRLKHCLNTIRGAFSLLLLTPTEMIGVRDRNGFRPLCLGRTDDGGHVIASESSALPPTGANFVREIRPGEVVRISRRGIRNYFFCDPKSIRPHHCIFEHIYFARPSSVIFGDTVHDVRLRLGAALARAHPVDADVVISVPDSGNSAAMGYSQESGIPLDRGLVRNHYVGRTFIQPYQVQREQAVRIKLSAVESVLRGKRIVVVEDSIVRGTTIRNIIKYLWDARPKEIHLRVTCPPIISPCFYGINFPTRAELLAASRTPEQTVRYLNLTSLGHLGIDDMLKCVSNPAGQYCTSCFTGRYPVRTGELTTRLKKEKPGQR
ncbi:MAG: amidophosphoribosyltransferase [Planctomycetota bacterium]